MTEAAAATPDATNRTDILVAGAGSTGLAAALAFAKSGMRVMLVGRIPPPLPGRTVALFEASLRFLDQLGALVFAQPRLDRQGRGRVLEAATTSDPRFACRSGIKPFCEF